MGWPKAQTIHFLGLGVFTYTWGISKLAILPSALVAGATWAPTTLAIGAAFKFVHYATGLTYFPSS